MTRTYANKHEYPATLKDVITMEFTNRFQKSKSVEYYGYEDLSDEDKVKTSGIILEYQKELEPVKYRSFTFVDHETFEWTDLSGMYSIVERYNVRGIIDDDVVKVYSIYAVEAYMDEYGRLFYGDRNEND